MFTLQARAPDAESWTEIHALTDTTLPRNNYAWLRSQVVRMENNWQNVFYSAPAEHNKCHYLDNGDLRVYNWGACGPI